MCCDGDEDHLLPQVNTHSSPISSVPIPTTEVLPGELEDILGLILDNRPNEAIENGGYLWVLLEIAGLVCPDVVLSLRSGHDGSRAGVFSENKFKFRANESKRGPTDQRGWAWYEVQKYCTSRDAGREGSSVKTLRLSQGRHHLAVTTLGLKCVRLPGKDNSSFFFLSVFHASSKAGGGTVASIDARTFFLLVQQNPISNVQALNVLT